MQNLLLSFQLGFPCSWLIAGVLLNHDLCQEDHHMIGSLAWLVTLKHQMTVYKLWQSECNMHEVWRVHWNTTQKLSPTDDYFVWAKINFSACILISLHLSLRCFLAQHSIQESSAAAGDELSSWSRKNPKLIWQNIVRYLCSWIFPTADGSLKSSLSDGYCHSCLK